MMVWKDHYATFTEILKIERNEICVQSFLIWKTS